MSALGQKQTFNNYLPNVRFRGFGSPGQQGKPRPALHFPSHKGNIQPSCQDA